MKPGFVIDKRWEIVKPRIGRGGQSDVHLVKDITGVVADKCVLKEIKRYRRDRFLNEVGACLKLKHLNIIKLHDHSSLDEGAAAGIRYLVMEYAANGDLTDRCEMYKDSLDSTLTGALAIAKGLQHAHAGGVTHRDVKPANILFRDMDHEAVVSDFGICLIRDVDRHTNVDEIVGPRNFMAPELEGGGKLEVTNAADIYSLGKVIYYMITGGIILPRERHREAQYDIFNKGFRHQLLGMLLDRMICVLDTREKDLKNIIAEIERIKNWENRKEAKVSEGIFSKYTKLMESEQKKIQIAEENKAIYQKQQTTDLNFLKTTYSWLTDHAGKIIKDLQNDSVKIELLRMVDDEVINIIGLECIENMGEKYYPKYMVGLKMVFKSDVFETPHCLMFFLALGHKQTVSFGTGAKAEFVDKGFYLFPFYFKDNSNRGFFYDKRNYVQAGEHEVVGSTFVGGPMNLGYLSKVSDWPANVEAIEKVIDDSLSAFMDYVANLSQKK